MTPFELIGVCLSIVLQLRKRRISIPADPFVHPVPAGYRGST